MNHAYSKSIDSLLFGLFFAILFAVFSLMSTTEILLAEDDSFLISGEMEETL